MSARDTGKSREKFEAICVCGDWQSDHEGGTGKCATCYFLKKCQKFDFAYEMPLKNNPRPLPMVQRSLPTVRCSCPVCSGPAKRFPWVKYIEGYWLRYWELELYCSVCDQWYE